jgi:hypothetical protein
MERHPWVTLDVRDAPGVITEIARKAQEL